MVFSVKQILKNFPKKSELYIVKAYKLSVRYNTV